MSNIVKKLSCCEFIKLLHITNGSNDNCAEIKRLKMAYNRFVNRIQQISKQETCSRLDSLQALARIRETLNRLQTMHKDPESLPYLLIRSSLSLVDFEKQMICLQLKYPGIREIHPQRHHSRLRISKRYTSTDLMEIIVPLTAIGFFCLEDDSPATFMQVTREFETLCNTTFKNPDNSRWAILNRKNRLTHIHCIFPLIIINLSN